MNIQLQCVYMVHGTGMSSYRNDSLDPVKLPRLIRTAELRFALVSCKRLQIHDRKID